MWKTHNYDMSFVWTVLLQSRFKKGLSKMLFCFILKLLEQCFQINKFTLFFGFPIHQKLDRIHAMESGTHLGFSNENLLFNPNPNKKNQNLKLNLVENFQGKFICVKNSINEWKTEKWKNIPIILFLKNSTYQWN